MAGVKMAGHGKTRQNKQRKDNNNDHFEGAILCFVRIAFIKRYRILDLTPVFEDAALDGYRLEGHETQTDFSTYLCL